jgi:hypothetical protein
LELGSGCALRLAQKRKHLYLILTTATASSANIGSLVTSCTDVLGRSRHFATFSANDRPALKNSGS